MIRVSVNGALGRMGSTVCQAVQEDSETELIESIDINSNNDKTLNSKPIFNDLSNFLSEIKPDVIVDFTNRESFMSLCELAIPKGIRIVSGSTGLLDEDYKKLR